MLYQRCVQVYFKLLRQSSGLRFFFGILALLLVLWLVFEGYTELRAYLDLLDYYEEAEDQGDKQAMGGATDLLFEAMCYLVVIFGSTVVTVVWVIYEFFADATAVLNRVIQPRKEKSMSDSNGDRLRGIEERLDEFLKFFEDLDNRIDGLEEFQKELIMEAVPDPQEKDESCGSDCSEICQGYEDCAESLCPADCEIECETECQIVALRKENLQLKSNLASMKKYVADLEEYYEDLNE